MDPVSQVEHVLREEKTKAAYELIEIYCELIAARLPMIESQKYVNPIVLSSLFMHVLLCLNSVTYQLSAHFSVLALILLILRFIKLPVFLCFCN